MIKRIPIFAAAAMFALGAASSWAAVSAEQAAKLGTTLTPLGGEKAGNKDGTIPEWTGGLTQAPAGYNGDGTHHVDPFAGDKPLFFITKENMEQYKSNLTPGVLALLHNYSQTFKIPVYQTRRTAAAPQWVYDQTKKNATTASLVEGGNGFKDAFGGIPFPIPQNGLEAIWNHMLRYRGSYVEQPMASAVVYPNGTRASLLEFREMKSKYYETGGSFAGLNNINFYYINTIMAPARNSGNSALVVETVDQVKEPRKAWAYVPGTRRVRRAPTLSYDSTATGSDGLVTIDNIDMFNGAPDRYEWKLIGKKEIYIPYNSYQISSPAVKYDDLMTPLHVNPDKTRFELHRVWVVEATLKGSARHVYSKRTMYLDEDSWQISLMDQYDSRGELWRTSMAHIKNYYQLPAMWVAAEVHHDLQRRTYYVGALDNEEATSANFSRPVPTDAFFEASGLRRRSTR